MSLFVRAPGLLIYITPTVCGIFYEGRYDPEELGIVVQVPNRNPLDNDKQTGVVVGLLLQIH